MRPRLSIISHSNIFFKDLKTFFSGNPVAVANSDNVNSFPMGFNAATTVSSFLFNFMCLHLLKRWVFIATLAFFNFAVKPEQNYCALRLRPPPYYKATLAVHAFVMVKVFLSVTSVLAEVFSAEHV